MLIRGSWKTGSWEGGCFAGQGAARRDTEAGGGDRTPRRRGRPPSPLVNVSVLPLLGQLTPRGPDGLGRTLGRLPDESCLLGGADPDCV